MSPSSAFDTYTKVAADEPTAADNIAVIAIPLASLETWFMMGSSAPNLTGGIKRRAEVFPFRKSTKSNQGGDHEREAVVITRLWPLGRVRRGVGPGASAPADPDDQGRRHRKRLHFPQRQPPANVRRHPGRRHRDRSGRLRA